MENNQNLHDGSNNPNQRPLDKIIDIRALKQSAYKFPKSSLRSIILEEKDTMTVQEFLIKMKTWLKLARIES